jgi:hypothetical protein
MTTPSAVSHEQQQQMMESHDATRGLLTAALMGALIWTAIAGLWNWVAA